MNASLKWCRCCARSFSDDLPQSMGNPHMCVPCFTGVELESVGVSMNAFPSGRWNSPAATIPKAQPGSVKPRNPYADPGSSKDAA